MTLEIGANLTSVVLAMLALIGTIVTAVLSYYNGKKIREVQRNTNGMTDRLVQAAFKDGKDLGAMEERMRSAAEAAEAEAQASNPTVNPK